MAGISQHDPVLVDADHPADTWITITTIATDPGGLVSNPGFVWKFKMTCTTTMLINENSPAGTTAGEAGRYGSGASSFTLVADSDTTHGDAASVFTIDSGYIKVKSGATLDYETEDTYTGTVKYKASRTVNGTKHTNDSERTVKITINNVTGPGKSAPPTVERDATTPTTKLDISWSAPSPAHNLSDYDVQYRQTGASSWTSHSFTGTGTSTEISGLTAGKSYDVQVRATDEEGTGPWSDSGVGITQYTTQTRSIAENSAVGTNIGAAVDADSNPNSYTLAYSLGGTDASSFDIGSSTGQITVKSGNIPDYETKTSYSVTVTMAVSGSSTASNTNTGLSPNGTGDYLIPVTINVTDVAKPGAPTVTVSPHTTKLSVSWTEPTSTPAITGYDVEYKLADDSNWTTQTHSGTGRTSTLTGLTAGKTYNVQVRGANIEGDGPWGSASAVTSANAVTRSIAENSAAGTSIGAVVTASANTNGYTLTHSLGGTDASDFDIVASSGQIQVKSALDYETKNSYSVTVTVKAAVAGITSESFTLDPNAPGDYAIPVTINVTDVNEIPEFPGPTATRSVAENSAAGTNVGNPVTATDPRERRAHLLPERHGQGQFHYRSVQRPDTGQVGPGLRNQE